MVTEATFLERSTQGILCSNTHVPGTLARMSLDEMWDIYVRGTY